MGKNEDKKTIIGAYYSRSSLAFHMKFLQQKTQPLGFRGWVFTF